MPKLINIFRKYEGSKIAIYGLSKETERVLPELEQHFQIIGLLDGYREEGMLYNQPIISIETAIINNAKLILVVARPGSCRAIANRIGKICSDNQIELFDIRGKNLCILNKVSYDFKDVNGITKQQLIQLINEKDVVSFDVFDTLIMRQTLFSSDVFEIIEKRLKQKGVYISDFSRKRLRCEQDLAKIGAPTLIEIYSYMKNVYSLSINPAEMAEMEWAIDNDLLIPRQEMCEILSYAYHEGKEIYLVSDTYYTKEQLIRLLGRFGVSYFTDIISSCDFATNKNQHLFEKVLDRVGKKSCIHIGDDLISDVESAKKYGIDTCQIYSGIDLLEMVGYLGLWDNIQGLESRIKIGMFVSRLFNSPFQFERSNRRISVKNSCDIGYLFFAPIISDFVIWFDKQVQCMQITNIWFAARDGYLVKKLYDELKGDTSSVYFLTSRTAAIRAGVEDVNDIKLVEEMQFSGNLQAQLQERFGISVNVCSENLLDYAKEILRKTAIDRKNYVSYISNLKVKEGNIAFFDFVAKGTSQMFLGRLIKNHIKGLYFLQLEEDSMREKRLDILSFCGTNDMSRDVIFDNYYILETILTSPMPSVKAFDELGKPYYAKETRKEEDIFCIQDVQNGISEYFKTYIKICPCIKTVEDKGLDALFLSLIHGISVLNNDFMNLKVEDPFFNRSTAMAELI